jgi:hypothetical protein
LECGSLVRLLRLELARGAAGSKPPAKESGSKLPHSKGHWSGTGKSEKEFFKNERTIRECL